MYETDKEGGVEITDRGGISCSKLGGFRLEELASLGRNQLVLVLPQCQCRCPSVNIEHCHDYQLYTAVLQIQLFNYSCCVLECVRGVMMVHHESTLSPRELE